MTLALLHIENLRNIESARLTLHPHLNVLGGPNGSGKTSLLEAIYLLSSGHSFRTREISPVIRHQAERLTVFARTQDFQTVSIQKSASSPTQVRLNQLPCQKSSELARFLPCQVFYQDMFQFIEAGPSVRRSLLDWGLFHVKQSYHALWKNYRRALKQRNSLLRQQARAQYLEPWNVLLDELAVQMDQLRRDYFSSLQKKFKEILPQITDVDCSLHYFKGWDKKESGKSLASILADSYPTDCQRQYTQHGAHQADLLVVSEDYKVKHYLSRGQQKTILFALKLAQIALIETECILLCDDLPSELDEAHLKRLISLIAKTKGQFFISCIQAERLHFADQPHAQFRINEGVIEADQ
ncbi:MAG: DNA replication/repair protein RecF [Tatlockia sp.]|jgi:DNA replication and repair protein RecF